MAPTSEIFNYFPLSSSTVQLYEQKGNESLKMDLREHFWPLIKGSMIYIPPPPASTSYMIKALLGPTVQKTLPVCGTWEIPIGKRKGIIVSR